MYVSEDTRVLNENYTEYSKGVRERGVVNGYALCWIIQLLVSSYSMKEVGGGGRAKA